MESPEDKGLRAEIEGVATHKLFPLIWWYFDKDEGSPVQESLVLETVSAACECVMD